MSEKRRKTAPKTTPASQNGMPALLLQLLQQLVVLLLAVVGNVLYPSTIDQHTTVLKIVKVGTFGVQNGFEFRGGYFCS